MHLLLDDLGTEAGGCGPGRRCDQAEQQEREQIANGLVMGRRAVDSPHDKDQRQGEQKGEDVHHHQHAEIVVNGEEQPRDRAALLHVIRHGPEDGIGVLLQAPYVVDLGLRQLLTKLTLALLLLLHPSLPRRRSAPWDRRCHD